ncbi:zinc ribbon domain-containing protein, partial [Mycobacterium kansasii]
WPQNATGGYLRMRVVILAAVKDDLALIAVATGPYHAYGPDFGPGIPSGANLDLALDMGKYVNSFRWRGDSRR